jgi:Phosphotransferase enzyme family
VLAGLDPVIAAARLPVPRLRGTVELGPWFALVIEDVDGRQPALPWLDEELDLVLVSLDRLCEALTPAPVAVPSISHYLGSDFSSWRILAGRGGDDRLDSWSRAHLGELAELEAAWVSHAEGSTLLHGDVRADNLLLADGRVMVVDWPHACRGAAFVDLVLLAPSVAMQSGPGPAELLARSSTGRDAAPEAVRAVVCALAGYFTRKSLEPPPPGLPTVRRFQAAQGEIARNWLASLLLLVRILFPAVTGRSGPGAQARGRAGRGPSAGARGERTSRLRPGAGSQTG